MHSPTFLRCRFDVLCVDYIGLYINLCLSRKNHEGTFTFPMRLSRWTVFGSQSKRLHDAINSTVFGTFRVATENTSWPCGLNTWWPSQRRRWQWPFPRIGVLGSGSAKATQSSHPPVVELLPVLYPVVFNFVDEEKIILWILKHSVFFSSLHREVIKKVFGSESYFGFYNSSFS